jgi:hypothetical protein
MQKEEINELARRLENAHRLSDAERAALYRDLERYAKSDLYGAARLTKDHLHKEANFVLPTVIAAAPRVGSHFEERIREARRPIDLYGEQDRQIRQPEDGREYRGPCVGTTPNCLIQRDRDTGDFIVHARHALNYACELTGNEPSLTISYPFKAVGGVGLVRDTDHEKQAEMGLQHALTREHDNEKEHSR